LGWFFFLVVTPICPPNNSALENWGERGRGEAGFLGRTKTTQELWAAFVELGKLKRKPEKTPTKKTFKAILPKDRGQRVSKAATRPTKASPKRKNQKPVNSPWKGALCQKKNGEGPKETGVFKKNAEKKHFVFGNWPSSRLERKKRKHRVGERTISGRRRPSKNAEEREQFQGFYSGRPKKQPV